jgi:hypothetical protein
MPVRHARAAISTPAADSELALDVSASGQPRAGARYRCACGVGERRGHDLSRRRQWRAASVLTCSTSSGGSWPHRRPEHPHRHRLDPRTPTGPRFTPRTPPDPDMRGLVVAVGRGPGSIRSPALLKRRLSDAVFRQLLTDANRPPAAGPGGQRHRLNRGGEIIRCLKRYIGRKIYTLLTRKTFNRPLDDHRSVPPVHRGMCAPGPGNVDAGIVAGYR